jgi:hypothetical protein
MRGDRIGAIERFITRNVAGEAREPSERIGSHRSTEAQVAPKGWKNRLPARREGCCVPR